MTDIHCIPAPRGAPLAGNTLQVLSDGPPGTFADLSRQCPEGTYGLGLDFTFDCAGSPLVREQATAVQGRPGTLAPTRITPQPPTVSQSLGFHYMKK
ncbi:hypothetical protein [Streptomyces sp. NPDC005262]|uniref:hypothetical protein n=1 Tax=Streptomyces sp. NPDC005262 TaxID=3364710 RepID=UPI00367FB753